VTDKNPPSPPVVPPIPVAAHVTSRHAPEWGKGIVTGKEGKLVRVLFVGHPAKKQVLVPAASLVVEHVSTWPDPSKVPEAAPSAPAASAKTKKKAEAPEVAPPAPPAPEEGPSSS
jgi:hypothetical protein